MLDVDLPNPKEGEVMEYVKLLLQRIELAAYDARKALEENNYEKAQASMFNIDTWMKVAKRDYKQARKG